MKPEPKPKPKPKLFKKFKDFFDFKKNADAYGAVKLPKGTAFHLNSGVASENLQNAYRLINGLAEALPEKKRKEILSSIDFIKTRP